MCPLEIDSFGPALTYPCPSSQTSTISDFAARVIDAAVRDALSDAGFDLATLRAEAVAFGTAYSGERSEYGERQVRSISVSRPSAVPPEVLQRFPRLEGSSSRFEISYAAGIEGKKLTAPQLEADWSAPDQWDPTVHAAGFCNSSGVWEFRFSREARPKLREEVGSVPPEAWAALILATDQINEALNHEDRDPLSATAVLQSLAAPLGSLGGWLKRNVLP